MAIDFAISMVVFNTERETLQKAIESISLQEVSFEFILVDHSPEKKYKDPLPQGQHWKYLPRENTGYGSGNNAGVATLSQSKYVLILNPDVILHPGCLLAAKQFFDGISHRSVGVISGKILHPDGSWQNLNKRFPSVLALFGRRFSPLQKIRSVQRSVERYSMVDCDPESTQEIDLLPGCFLCLRREAWESIQGFDEGFFLYFEDYDLCQKLRAQGFRVIYTPLLTITHEYQRKSHSSLSHFIYFAKSMIRFFWKWGVRWS